MSAEFASSLFFVGRLLLGGAFVFAGLRNLTNIPALTGLLAGRGVPQARPALYLGIAWQVVCGILLVGGLWIAWAAVGLIAFLLVATPVFHNFWAYQGIDRGNRINGWASNVALAGAFLAVIASAP